MALTHLLIETAKPAGKPYRLADGNGLYLEVRPSGSKFWRYRYRIEGKENIYSIGPFCPTDRLDHVSLARARTARDMANVLVKQGIHPGHQSRSEARVEAAVQNSFQAVAEEWLSKKQFNWGVRQAKAMRHNLEKDVFPAIGDTPIGEVTPDDILRILRAVQARGASSYAHLIRQWTSAIFRYGVITQRNISDPTATLNKIVIRKDMKHTRPLSRAELSSLLNAMESYQGEPSTIFGLKLMLLTFIRTQELRGARWSDINISAGEWRIPASRIETRGNHIVPLSRQAIEILEALHKLNGYREFVFPNTTNPEDCMSSGTLNKALANMGFGPDGIGFSTNGFRVTARTMLADAGFRPEIIELQLGHHSHGLVGVSLNGTPHMQERREMMQAWADRIDSFRGASQNMAQF